MVLHINKKGWGASELECQFSGKKNKISWRPEGKVEKGKNMGSNAPISK